MRKAGHVACIGRGQVYMTHRVLVRKPQETDHWEGLHIDEGIILKWILKTWDGGMDFLDLAQDRDRWWALVNVVS
jgi:hypothetical protein